MKRGPFRRMDDKQLREVVELHQQVLGKLSIGTIGALVWLLALSAIVGALVYGVPVR